MMDEQVIRRAAELYLESNEAQHGDEELALMEARHWAGLFEWAELDIEEGEDDDG